MKKHLIFYRGPLERSRLSLIIEAAQAGDVALSFFWVFPGALSNDKREHALQFLEPYGFSEIIFRAEGFLQIVQTNLAFRRFISNNGIEVVYLVGFSAPLFGVYKGNTRRVWFINGIPEEKEAKGRSFLHQLTARFLWKLQGWTARCSLVVTVSTRMSGYVARKTLYKDPVHIPTCTSLEQFRPKAVVPRRYFTYLGSGAPWQALDLLEAVWYEIHRQDPAIRFRVISRDERCRVLGARIKKNSIEFTSSSDFSEVARYLHEAEAGFLLRKDTIVNRVCFPTKLAEYLAAGCWVVSSSIDWDVADYFHKYQIGVLVEPTDEPMSMAKAILSYREFISNGSVRLQTDTTANKLDRNNWVSYLKKLLNNL